MRLSGRRILIGVTGGIAAYKIPELVRQLKAEGASVRLVMTEAAQSFVTALTLQTLSEEVVRTELVDPEQEFTMGHIELARWPDIILVAPATADFLSRLAGGGASDLLSSICLASRKPMAVAPAMNTVMWENAATQANMEKLKALGFLIWGPESGDLACGESGEGRMQQPQQLSENLVEHFSSGPLKDVRVMVTAGPTHEPIDPVRYIGNRSSGKMGFALAQAFAQAGAQVNLVSGPVDLATPAGVQRHDVETALQMHDQVLQLLDQCDLFAACAAVADYRVQEIAQQKIKKTDNELTLQLIKNPDILAEVAALDNAPYTLGFAAETQDVENLANKKRLAKNIDLIAANLVGADQGGFADDNNELLLLWDHGKLTLPMQPKTELAKALVEQVTRNYLLRK